MKTKLLIILFFATTSLISAQKTLIPDAKFEQYLIQSNIDSDGTVNGEVLTADISGVKQIDISLRNITDLTGLQNFTSLTYLNAFENKLTSINVSQNTNLEQLYLTGNKLTSIDVSNNVKLIQLSVSDNLLTSIDVSKNVKLESLSLTINQLTTLDVSNNIKLTSLKCGSNNINNLNVNNVIDLEELWVPENKLSQLDISGSTKLKSINAGENDLTTIDLSNHLVLENVSFNDNKLTELNIKNGNNVNITTFRSDRNFDLSCIKVDDANYSANNSGWTKHFESTYLETCGEGTFIPDANFELYIESLGLGNGINDDKYVDTNKILALTTLDISNRNISNAEGLQDFVALTSLNVSRNQITTINVSKLINLEEFVCFDNKLKSLDVSKNTALKTLNFGKNEISEIDVKKLTELDRLFAFNNKLTELDVSKNTKLEVLNCSTNLLESLNVYSNINLENIDAFENKLSFFDIQKNIKLINLSINDNELIGLNLKNANNTKIEFIFINNNPNLTCIEVDDIAYSNTNWTHKDAQSTFSRDCTPVNDNCANAIPLTFGQQTPGDVNSGNSNNNATCVTGTVIADVWFSFNVPKSGEFSVEGTGFGGELKFAVYENCTTAMTLACGKNISLKNLTSGSELYLKVWIEAASGKNATKIETGTFTIKAEETSVLSVENFEELGNQFLLYPNPAEANFTISSTKNTIQNIEIFNVLGKKVWSKSVKNQSKININSADLSKGIYMIKVNSDNKIISKKLIIN
ncbi:MAG: T9SS type A sorting domain-containing protein [Polaribacter sp.]